MSRKPIWKPVLFPCKCFVSCAPHLEPLLTKELTELGFKDISPGYAGVFVPIASTGEIYRLNYASRLGSRVLLPISFFQARNKFDLYDQAAAINWAAFGDVSKTIAIDAHVQHREFRNSLFAAQIVKDAICDFWRDRGGKRPSVDTYNPDLQLNLFLQQDRGVLSIDTSGTPLHKRGYRVESVEAPLQETLAAALLHLGGYEAGTPLCDPCCGSGTFLIEAALMASKTPPGFLRHRWGFMNLPNFNQTDWLRVKNELDAERIPIPFKLFMGADNNKNAVRIARTNARAAGMDKSIEITLADVREYVPTTEPSFVITNPPYGLRLEDTDSLKSLYRGLGDFMKTKMKKPAKGMILTGSLPLSKEIGLAAKQRHVIDNGGIEARCLEFELW